MLGVDRYGFSPTSGDLVAVIHPCLSALGALAFFTLRNGASFKGPDTEGMQARRSSYAQVGTDACPTAARERHQQLDG